MVNREKIHYTKLKNITTAICIDANYYLEENIINLWLCAKEKENYAISKLSYDIMLSNAYYAYINKKPLCQDTGQMIFFLEHDGSYYIPRLIKHLEAGVEEAAKIGYLREPMVEAIERSSSGFLPITVHEEIKKKETFKITVIPTGGGCEQVSCTKVIVPFNIQQNIEDFVISKVKEAGGLPCPPVFLGIGIGENIEQASYIARRALYHLLTEKNLKPTHFEKYLLDKINTLNIGPQGLGGNTTCLGLKLEASYCHRANLPISIIFCCHLGRYKQINLLSQKNYKKNYSYYRNLENYSYYKNLENRNFLENRNLGKIPVSNYNYKKIDLPLTEEKILTLKAGDLVLLNGIIYTGRDLTHQKLLQDMKLASSLKNQVIYYAGPSPAREGQIIGACGPTTSMRMDNYTEYLLSKGLKGMIGKGQRNTHVKQASQKYKALYFITWGGAGAYLSEKIIRKEVLAYEELGCEALLRLEVKDFPCIVAYDMFGGDIFS